MSAATLTSTGARRIVWAITGAVLCLAVAAAAGLALAAGAPTQRASGDQQWAQLFTPPGQLDCRAVAAVAAPDGSLYVAASAAVATGAPHDIVLLKYSPDGTPAWQRTMGGSGDDRPAAPTRRPTSPSIPPPGTSIWRPPRPAWEAGGRPS